MRRAWVCATTSCKVIQQDFTPEKNLFSIEYDRLLFVLSRKCHCTTKYFEQKVTLPDLMFGESDMPTRILFMGTVGPNKNGSGVILVQKTYSLVSSPKRIILTKS